MPKHLFLLSSILAAQPALAQDDEIVIADQRVDPTTITVTATGTGSGVENTGQPVTVIGQAEIDAHEVGLAVLEPLRSLDEVAYLRFASVYQAFDNLEDFEQAITLLRVERDALGEEPDRGMPSAPEGASVAPPD